MYPGGQNALQWGHMVGTHFLSWVWNSPFKNGWIHPEMRENYKCTPLFLNLHYTALHKYRHSKNREKTLITANR